MPCNLLCPKSPVSPEEVQELWNAVIHRFQDASDDEVSIRCVSIQEITDLNARYRSKNAPTNVLTFSYTDISPAEHDIALCMDIVVSEVQERGGTLRDYVALLIVHAMLHAVGLDHEASSAEHVKTQELEREILSECRFVSTSLSDVY